METPSDFYLILLGLLFVSFLGVGGLPKDSLTTTLDSYIWTEEVSLAPLNEPMPDELPLCDIGEGRNGCLLESLEPMTWNDAHKYCRNLDAFLPSCNQSQYLGKQWPNKWAGNFTWTALTNYLGHYQWLGRSPFDTPARADFIKWKDPPKNWSTDCASFDVISGDFQLDDCLRKLDFFCVLKKKESASDKTIDFSDMELKVEVRASRPIEENYGWIKVSQEEFNDLVLTCQAFSRSTGERLSRQPHIFWRKDNVYIDHSTSGLQPSTVHDSSKSESVVPGISELVIQKQLAQGTYWCETWIPKSEERLKSNKMLITLEDWVTIILRANRYEPVDGTQEEMQAELCTIFKEHFSSLDEYIWDVISTEKEAVDNSSLWLTKYGFHVHMPRKDMNELFFANRNFSRMFHDIFKKANFLDTSSFTLATFCYKQKEYLKSESLTLVWPFTEAGKVYPKNLKCKVDYGRLSPGVCKGDYNNGAYLDFDPSPCQWLDRCPVGYKNIRNKFCVTLSQSQRWEKAFKENHKTGQETTILDKVDLPKFRMMFSSFRNYAIQTSNQSKLWLPVKRVGHLGPLIYQGSGTPQWKIQNYDEFEKSGITWLEQNPHSDQDCLSFDLETKKLQTSDCQEKLPFLAVIDLQDTPKQGKSLAKLSPECADQDRGSCLCPPGWSTPVFKGENETCFKLFSSKENFTWDKANEFCSEKGAQLPTPNVGFLDWVYRQHLIDTNVSSVWMDIKWVPDRIVYSGSKDNFNWLPETNYRHMYGVLRQDGWILESNETVKQNVLCQQIIQQNVSVELRVNEPSDKDSQTMCIDINPVQLLMSKEKENIQCFVNGIGLNPEQTKDSGCQYELKVNRQGYYQCHTWTRPPYRLVKSNIILHRDFSTYTFVITLHNEEAYHPEKYDATFQSRRQAKSSKQCSDIVRRHLETSDLNSSFRFSDTLSFYTPNSNFTQVLHSFHLECEIKEAKMKEKDLLEALRDRLIKNEVLKESGCYFEEIRSTVGCLASVSVDEMATLPRNLTWPETIGNEIVVSEELCITPEGDPATRECLGNFIEGYYWHEPSHNCSGNPSNVTKTLWEINRSAVDSTVGAILANLTANKSSLLPVDIYLIAKTFQNLSEGNDSIYHFDDIVTVVSNIMGANATAFEVIQRKLNSSSTLLEAFEELTFKVQLSEADGDQIKKSSGDNVAVDRLDLEANSTIIGLKSMGNSEEYLHMGFKKEDLANAEVAIIFPNNLTYTVSTKTSQKPKNADFDGNNEKVSLVFAIYQNEKFFQDISRENYTVNSHIIMASYKGEVIKDLEEPVRILFKPLKAGNDTKCVYWDFMLNNKRGGWSEKGCMKGERQGQHDVCLCNHLTNFAQLINYGEDSGFEGSHVMVLDIITIIGCCLSIIGLLLVFATFCLFKKWRRSLSNKILVNLSFSVFCSMVIFLAGIDQSWNDPLCRSVAVGLHYFILASFGWMLVEAVHQYLKFVKVVGTYIPRFLWKASVCAWGIPVLPVLSVLIYDHSLYDSRNDYNSVTRICWMSVQGFKYAFLPPLALTMTVNVIMYSLIIHGAICGRARVNSTMSERTLFMNQLRMAVCVFFLLGFTWIFGLLAVSHLRQVFSYLFCIFNTLQGVFLFLCHICREQGARKYWKDFLSVLTKDPVSSTPGNSFNQFNSPILRGHPDSVSFDKCGGILVLPQGPPLRHHLRRGRGSLLSAQTNSTLLQSRISFSP